MYLSIWNVNVNGRIEQFATDTSNIEDVIRMYKSYFKNKFPDKAFNFESIQRVTGVELIGEATQS